MDVLAHENKREILARDTITYDVLVKPFLLFPICSRLLGSQMCLDILSLLFPL